MNQKAGLALPPCLIDVSTIIRGDSSQAKTLNDDAFDPEETVIVLSTPGKTSTPQSLSGPAAIYSEGPTGTIGRRIGCQEQGKPANLRQFAPTAQRNFGYEILVLFRVIQ